jgi:prepilin-type N-terminal cleavage/methylation domain-containing protein
MARLRYRSQEGFGLIELLIALTVLAVGILGVASAFISGMVTLRRAGTIATATALADKQLELYRAIRYCSIYLDGTTIPAADAAAWNQFGTALVKQPDSNCTSVAMPEATRARQDLSGDQTPDGRPYRIDTFITRGRPVSTPAIDSRELKTVIVVVRDGRALSKTLVRQESTFDRAFG